MKKEEIKTAEIGQMLGEGYTYKEIQEELGVSPTTIAKTKKSLENVSTETNSASEKKEVGYFYISNDWDNPIFAKVVPEKFHEDDLRNVLTKFESRFKRELKTLWKKKANTSQKMS